MPSSDKVVVVGFLEVPMEICHRPQRLCVFAEGGGIIKHVCQVVGVMAGLDECQPCRKMGGAKLLGNVWAHQARRRRKASQILRTPVFGFHGDEVFGSMSGHKRLADGARPPKLFAPLFLFHGDEAFGSM